MKKLTLEEARQEIADRELWLWRQKHWGNKHEYEHEKDFCDYDAAGPGLENMYWEIPNM